MDTIQREILDRARRGEWFGDAPTGDAGPGDDAPRVEATFLRSLLLGTYGDGQQPPLGVRLRGVVVEGCLDLRDCCGTGDSGLPPILLRHCILAGNRHRAGLAAVGSEHDATPESGHEPDQAICLLADYATLGRLSLHDCKAGRISLKDACVQSELELVRLSPLQADTECQLHAPGVQVDGSVVLCGTRLQIRDGRRSDIIGAVWQYACHLTDSEINGDLVLQPGFSAIGGLSIAGARISGSVWATAARFEATGLPSSDADSLAADEGRCAFRAQRSKCSSVIILSKATFAGYVDFLTAEARELHLLDITIASGTGIGALSARFAANVEISLSQDIRTSLLLRNSWIGDDLVIRNLSGQIDISLVHVGGDLKLSLGDSLALPVNVDATSIEVMGKATLEGMVVPYPLQSDGLGPTRPPLCFDGGRFHGSFAARGLTLVSDSATTATLSLDDAVVSRVFQAKGINALRTSSLESQVEDFESRTWRSRSLPFYGPDWYLLEVLGSNSAHGRSVVAFLRRKDGDGATILDGSSHRIHALNQSLGLDLSTAAMAQEYLRLFCDYVWGEEGAFHVETIRSCEQAADHWKIDADMHYGGEIHAASLRVQRNGLVEMLDDAPTGKKPPRFRFKPPFRIPAPEVDDPFWTDGGDKVFDADEVSRTVRGRVGRPGKALVSMRGVRAGVFNLSRDSFGDGVNLALEGLEYGSLRSSEELKGQRNDLAYYRDVLLDRQFGDGTPNKDEYKPQPYEQLSRVLRNHGELENARDVALEKLRLDRKLVYKWYTQLWHLFMEVGFKHGLSASRGTATFLLVLALGAVLFNALNHGVIAVPLGPLRTAGIPVLADPVDYPRMVVDAIPVSPLVLDNGGAARELAPDPRNAYGETWCGEQMDPVWYALDVMVPLLDLKHRDKCDVSGRDDAWGWRFLKALYALVGAAVTSIYLLAISGVLKRRVET